MVPVVKHSVAAYMSVSEHRCSEHPSPTSGERARSMMVWRGARESVSKQKESENGSSVCVYLGIREHAET